MNRIWISLKIHHIAGNLGVPDSCTRSFDVFFRLHYQIVTQFFHEVGALGAFLVPPKQSFLPNTGTVLPPQLEDGEKGGRSGQAEKLIICGNERGRRGSRASSFLDRDGMF